MIGFYHGSNLPAKESLKSGIYFIVNEGKGKLYRVLADATEPVLVAETTDASLIADVAKAKEDIQKNATSVANALESIAKITAKHGVELENITTEVSAVRTLAQGAADLAATNKADIKTANGKITANENAIAAIKDGTTIDSFADVENALAGKQAVGDYATKTEAQGYANTAAKAVDDKLGFTPDEANATLKAYVDKKTEGIATEGAMTQLGERVTAIERDYLTSVEEKELSNAIALKADKTALEGEVTRATGEEARIAGLVTAEETRAKGEEARIEGLVTAEASRAAGVEEALDGRLEKVEAFFEGAAEDGEGLQNALDTLVEIQTYVNTHGEAAAKMVEDIAANADAIEDMDAAYKAADVALQGKITTLEGEMDSAEGRLDDLEAKFGNGEGTVEAQIAAAVAAEAGLRETGVNEAKAAAKTADDKAKTAGEAAAEADRKAVVAQNEVDALEEVVATKAAAADLTTLAGRVTTAEGKITTLEGEMDDAEGRLTAVEKKANDNTTAIGTNTTNIAALMAALEWKQA